MKTTHKALLAGVAGLSLLAVPSVIAVPLTSGFNYQDIDSYSSTVTSGHNLQGSFSITDGSTASVTIPNGFSNDGVTFTDIATFNNATETISSASVYFYIENGNSANDMVTIDLTDDSGFFSGRTGNANFIVGDSLGSAAITFLNNNGTLSFTIANTGTSDFKVDAAQLQVFTQPQRDTHSVTNPSVPDGGSTALMLGCGLLGCVAFEARRRMLRPLPVRK